MKRLEDSIDPARHRVRMVPGYAAEDGMVSIGGLEQPALWLQHVTAEPGDPIWIILISRPSTPSIAIVQGVGGQYTPATPPPVEGVVSTAPTGAEKITLETSDGPIEAPFLAQYTPQVSDRVRILWQGDDPLVLGPVAAKIPPPPPKQVKGGNRVQAPPGSKRAGQDTFAAADSATWSTGTSSWNSYFGKDLYQGSYSSIGANRGAWFYHGKPNKLRGKKATSVEIYVPRRSKAGNYNATVELQVYLHASERRPRGDVKRSSHTTISIPKNFKGGWKDLPSNWGSAIIGGDGIGLSGGAYAGFEGVKKSPSSGQLRITWED